VSKYLDVNKHLRVGRREAAQMHTLEVIIVSVILFAALFFLYKLPTPSTTTSYDPLNQLKIIGDEILRNLDKNVTDKAEYHNSTLVEYIFTNNTENFARYCKEFLPSTVLYNIWIYNVSSQKLSLWYPNEEQISISSTVRSHRLIVYHGHVYDVEMEMWYV